MEGLILEWEDDSGMMLAGTNIYILLMLKRAVMFGYLQLMLSVTLFFSTGKRSRHLGVWYVSRFLGFYGVPAVKSKVAPGTIGPTHQAKLTTSLSVTSNSEWRMCKFQMSSPVQKRRLGLSVLCTSCVATCPWLPG